MNAKEILTDVNLLLEFLYSNTFEEAASESTSPAELAMYAKQWVKEMAAEVKCPPAILCAAVKAIEKDIPVEVPNEKFSVAECPNCGVDLGEHLGDGYVNNFTNLDRCPHCWQSIKWKNYYDDEDEGENEQEAKKERFAAAFNKNFHDVIRKYDKITLHTVNQSYRCSAGDTINIKEPWRICNVMEKGIRTCTVEVEYYDGDKRAYEGVPLALLNGNEGDWRSPKELPHEFIRDRFVVAKKEENKANDLCSYEDLAQKLPYSTANCECPNSDAPDCVNCEKIERPIEVFAEAWKDNDTITTLVLERVKENG